MSGAGIRKIVPITSVAESNPTAGSYFTFILPGSSGTFPSAQRLKSVRYGLTTSSSAGNRNPGLYVTDSVGNVLWLVLAPAAQSASLTQYYTFAAGGNTNAVVASQNYISIPEMDLPSGYKVVLYVGSMLAADQQNSIVVAYQNIA